MDSDHNCPALGLPAKEGTKAALGPGGREQEAHFNTGAEGMRPCSGHWLLQEEVYFIFICYLKNVFKTMKKDYVQTHYTF